MGARVESSISGVSLLSYALKPDLRILLLKHGADPNKIVTMDFHDRYPKMKLFDGRQPAPQKEDVPVFVLQFIDPYFEGKQTNLIAFTFLISFIRFGRSCQGAKRS